MEQMMTIKSTKGLHASLASKLVQLASRYDAQIHLQYEDVVIDAKSILGLLSLAIPQGENIRVTASGIDAAKALKEIQKLLE
jgi:phosphocarrier protein HPr